MIRLCENRIEYLIIFPHNALDSRHAIGGNITNILQRYLFCRSNLVTDSDDSCIFEMKHTLVNSQTKCNSYFDMNVDRRENQRGLQFEARHWHRSKRRHTGDTIESRRGKQVSGWLYYHLDLDICPPNVKLSIELFKAVNFCKKYWEIF